MKSNVSFTVSFKKKPSLHINAHNETQFFHNFEETPELETVAAESVCHPLSADDLRAFERDFIDKSKDLLFKKSIHYRFCNHIFLSIVIYMTKI